MNLKLKKGLFTIIVTLSILCINSINAQTSDLASWNGLEVKYKLNKKWAFSLEGQLRLKEDISTIDNYFTQFNTEYKFIKNFKLVGAVRYIRENDNKGNIQGYENHFRFNIDALYKHEIGNFELGYRLRYQNKNELGVSESEGDFPNQNIRFKTGIAYNIKNWKLDPKFSAEIFNRFQEGKDNGFNKYRITLGTDYKINDSGKIKVYYRVEKQLNVDFPDTTNIIGLKYTYSIN